RDRSPSRHLATEATIFSRLAHRGNQVDRITVCEQKEPEFRAGEQLQIKANLKTKEGLRLANGSIVTLEGVDPDTGDLQIKDKLDRVLTLDPSVRMLQYGYASTSYGSQGKTVDHVLISDSQCKAATNQKEFYVSISRGRQSVAFTQQTGKPCAIMRS